MRKIVTGVVLGFCVFLACAGQIGPVGDIFSVVAGNGLTGGGIAGDVTLDIAATSGRGLTVNANDIGITACASPGQAQVWNGSAYACAAVGSGISGLTTGTIPKAASATTLDDSIITQAAGAIDIGGALNVATALVVYGNTNLGDAASDTVTIPGIVGIRGTPSAGTALYTVANGLQNGWVINAVQSGYTLSSSFRLASLSEAGTFDTTASARSSTGIYSEVFSSRSAGANDLTNYAFYADAQLGQSNYSFWGQNGTLNNQGPITEAGNRVFSIAGTGGTSSGPTYNVIARQRAAAGDWGLEVRADDIGLTDNCLDGQVLRYDDGSAGVLHSGEWDCVTLASGGGPGTGTAGTLPIWATGTTLGDSIAVQSGTVVTFTDTVRATSNAHAPSIRWGSATDGTTGQFATSGGVVTYLDFIDDLQLRIADNSYITPLQISNAGVSTFNFDLNSEANVQLDDTGDITFSSTTTAGGAVDTGIARSAAGQVVINDGDGITTTDYRDVVFRNGFSQTLIKTISTGEIQWSSTTALAGASDVGLVRSGVNTLMVNDGGGILDTDYRDFAARNIFANLLFKTVAAGELEWSSTTSLGGATDTGLKRNAAGVLEVNNGTAATWRDLIARTHFGGGTAAGTSFKAHSVGRIEWSSTTAHTGASDLGLERAAAGSLVINDGAGVTVADMRDLNARSVFSNLVAGTAFKAVSTGRLEWSSTTLIGGASDVGLERSAAGVLVVNDGAGILTADLRDLTARYLTASGSFATSATGTNFNNLLDSKGYIVDTSGAPTLSSCGTGPTSTTGRNGITVVTGTGATGCTITFGGPGSFASTPSCVVSSQTANKGFTYTVSTTAVTLASASASNAYDIVCIGH